MPFLLLTSNSILIGSKFSVSSKEQNKQPTQSHMTSTTDYGAITDDKGNSDEGNHQQQQNQETTNTDKYPLDPRRWVALGCLCAVGGISSAQQMNFASVTKASKHLFGVNDEEIDWFVAVFYLSFILFSFFAMTLFERYGLRFVLLLASIFNSLATILKIIAVQYYPGYYALILAQILCAFGQPLYMPLPPAMAMTWFPEDQRAIATSVAALCTALGTALGMLYAPFIVTGDGTTELFVKYLSVQCAFSCVETIINIIFVVEEPTHPPSAGAILRRQEASKHHHTPIIERMKQMAREIFTHFKQPNKALLLVGGGIFVGTLYAVPGAMCQVFGEWGISNSACGLISGGIIIVGLIEGTIAGLYVDKTKKYKSTMIVCCSIGVVGMIVAAVTIMLYAPVWVVGLSVVVGGAPLLGAFGVILDTAAEEAFPLDEIFASTGVIYVGCLFAFVEMNAVPAILTAGDNPKLMSIIVWGVFLVCMIFGTICLLLWTPELPRMKFEQQKRAEEEQAQQQQQGDDDTDEQQRRNESETSALIPPPKSINAGNSSVTTEPLVERE